MIIYFIELTGAFFMGISLEINDFTKEELETILNWAEVYGDFGQSWVAIQLKPLMDKIQSMIDNYCEHKNCESCIDCNGCSCKACGKRWEYDNQ